MRTYGQYCPIARTAEIVSERWTPILIRNLLAGCHTFGELLEGAPGISRALLAQRLDLLERQGVVNKTPSDDRRVRWTYELTERGRELKQITDAMGEWGARWLELQPEHHDPAYVVWATARLVDVDALSPKGLVVRVDLSGTRPYWLLLRRPVSEVCTTSQGRDDDLVLRTDSETLARIHLRHLSFADATRNGSATLLGAVGPRRELLRALRPSPFAHVRPA